MGGFEGVAVLCDLLFHLVLDSLVQSWTKYMRQTLVFM